MNEIRTNSSPNISSAMAIYDQPYDDSALEGVAPNVKLLLKLIEDHKDACGKGRKDSRRMLRVATMMTILDNIRTRIQKCQSFGNRRADATNPQPDHQTRDKKPGGGREALADEKEKLRRELSACMAGRKSLEMMCSSLGKEKEIMAAHLSRKVHELNEMEELVNDLKNQNENLAKKVQGCASNESQVNAVLHDRNEHLSDLILRLNDEYRMTKKKLKEMQEENAMVYSTIDEMGAEIGASLERVRRFKDVLSLSPRESRGFDVQDEIMALENMFECFKIMMAKHGRMKKREVVDLKNEINAFGAGEDAKLDKQQRSGFNAP